MRRVKNGGNSNVSILNMTLSRQQLRIGQTQSQYTWYDTLSRQHLRNGHTHSQYCQHDTVQTTNRKQSKFSQHNTLSKQQLRIGQSQHTQHGSLQHIAVENLKSVPRNFPDPFVYFTEWSLTIDMVLFTVWSVCVLVSRYQKQLSFYCT